MVSQFMQAAADDLGFELDIRYAERNHFKMVDIAKEIAGKKSKPDFLLIVNENQLGPRLLEIAQEAGIQSFLILNDLTDEQKKEFGHPRQKMTSWVGTMVPDNVYAGYAIAKSLIKETPGILPLLAINGMEATPAAQERFQGLEKALAEHSQVKLLQKFVGDWRQDLAETIAFRALKRYPNTQAIWCANDPMALGAIQAVKTNGQKPGQDVLISGLNWSLEALDAIELGTMKASAGGHFMLGGWSLVLLYDYLNGKDFIQEEGVEIKQRIFSVINRSNVEMYRKHFGKQEWGKIDFKKFSKVKNPTLLHYDFSLDALMDQFP